MEIKKPKSVTRIEPVKVIIKGNPCKVFSKDGKIVIKNENGVLLHKQGEAQFKMVKSEYTRIDKSSVAHFTTLHDVEMVINDMKYHDTAYFFPSLPTKTVKTVKKPAPVPTTKKK